MKNFVSKYLIMLGGSLIIFSCSSLLDCEPKPDIIEYHIGLFQSLPQDTKAVFESNTGKLDTLVYNKINIDTLIEDVGLKQSRCSTQYKITYYEYQNMKFKHNLGLDNISFYRETGTSKLNSEKHSYQYDCNIDNNSYPIESSLSHELSFMNYNDVSQLKITKYTLTKEVIGSFMMSKGAGLLQVKYNDFKDPNDSVFTFKHFIQ